MTAGVFPQHIIARKRDGRALGPEEIRAFVRGACDGSWADYQLAALLMAITLRGMSAAETAELTRAVMESGATADLSAIRRPKGDKHSTGGVGDKVSLHLAPMVAACGAAVPMISGRGLGHTGGTLDKLEAIAGFRSDLSLREFREQVERVGVAIVGQTAELAPADKRLYALRDVTATVECVPLICASIMGKKLVEGIDALVLDVKFGRGAFMPDRARAKELAEAMVAIGRAMNKPVRAFLTAMDQPLGRSVGNAVEVAESVDCLRGHGPADLMEVTFALGGAMLELAGLAPDAADARRQLEGAVASGAAFGKLRDMVAAQGGDPALLDDLRRLPRARLSEPVPASRRGYVRSVDAMGIALAALRLGAGRAKAGDAIDPSVGLTDLVKTGERVERGQPLCTLHANDEQALDEARLRVAEAITFADAPAPPAPLVAEEMG
ncbi:MAG: thymidine phosphorylase [Opitutaceae bacterium]